MNNFLSVLSAIVAVTVVRLTMSEQSEYIQIPTIIGGVLAFHLFGWWCERVIK